jgi:hypothetical protein
VFEVDAILGEDGSKVINLLELIIIIYLWKSLVGVFGTD